MNAFSELRVAARVKRDAATLKRIAELEQDIPVDFREKANNIYSRIEDCERLAAGDQERLAIDILGTYVQVCVHTEAKEWISDPNATD